MNPATLQRLLVVLLLAGTVGVGLWAINRERPASPDPETRDRKTTRPGTPARPPEEHPTRKLDAHLTALREAGNPEDAKSLLADLRSWLDELPPDEAAALIDTFMASGRDADLPLEFQVGEEGFLDTPPTLRVALLDLLGELHPEAAHDLSRDILSSPTSPDEWAVALRNVARFDPEQTNHDFLRTKTEELLRNPQWQAQPSVGFLNAFDVLVHTRATQSTPLLSGFLKNKERRDLAHASFLTLDRLTQREPTAMLDQLREDEALHQSRPEMVAQQFARADLRQPDQRRIVRTWLLDPDRTPTELDSFAGIFPNNNQMVSHNLLTRNTPPQGEELRAHDEAVLAIVNQWSTDPDFQRIRPQLATMQQRLLQFTRSGATTPAE